jgi:thiamine kinase-like enzyme
VGSSDPDLAAVLEAVPELARLEREITPITLGITNRNFRVDVGGASYVVRLAGRDTGLLGIDRSAEFAAASAAAAAGVAPEVVAFVPRLGALITRFVEAERLSEEDLDRRDVIEAVVLAVRAIHSMARLPSRFDPFMVVRKYRATAMSRGITIPPEYDEAISITDRIQEALRSRPMPERPCHNDLLNANFLVRDGRVLIVDYEYAGMGDPFFDLGNLAVNNSLSERAEQALIDAYFGRVTASAIARLALMRIVSDFREAMWGVVQQALSTLDVDYVEYAKRHFARCLEHAAGADFERRLSDAAGEP